jgi:surfeit locus 1 family protein
MMRSKLWIAVGALLLAGAGFARLGRWQLDRADFNRAIESAFAGGEGLPAIARPVASDEADAMRFRRIRLSGRYEPGAQILLDNMIFDGEAGYEVLTPFEPETGGPLVLVNRGWVPGSADRSVLPDVSLPAQNAMISGRIDHLPRAALRLSATPIHAGTVTVMSFPDFADIEAVLGRPVAAFEILLDPAAEHGFARDWQPPPDRSDRNIAYAVQWFGLSLLAFVLAAGIVVRRFRRPGGTSA